ALPVGRENAVGKRGVVLELPLVTLQLAVVLRARDGDGTGPPVTIEQRLVVGREDRWLEDVPHIGADARRAGRGKRRRHERGGLERELERGGRRRHDQLLRAAAART